MKILLTIAARGGSKGVKNKNVRELCGKPLIAWSIEQAVRWGKADRIVVSTDSPEIAGVARRCGAEVPFMRPPELATDTAGKLPVLRHALTECEKVFSAQYEWLIDLDVTAPFRKISDLDAAFNEARLRGALTLFSVVPAHKSPYFNMVEKDTAGIPRLCKKLKKPILRRQDAPAVYDLNASIYVYKTEFFRNNSALSLFTPRTAMYIMDPVSSRDIDTEADFKFAEYLIREKVWRPDYD